MDAETDTNESLADTNESLADDNESLAGDELTRRECWELIRGEAYGRLAVAGPTGPDVFPVNVVVDHATIVFRTALGAKTEAIRHDPRVAFEVDGTEDNGQVWSVVVRGSAIEVSPGPDGILATELGVTPWQEGPKPVFVRVVPDSVSGRRFGRVAQHTWEIAPTPPSRTSPVES